MGKRLGVRQWMALKLFRKLRNIRREEHVLNTLFWECTLRCNLKCRHCGSDCTVDPALKDMPAKDFFRVLDNDITPNVNPNKVLIILSGGEVLVRKDLEDIGINLYRRGYPWGMVTNGLGLTRQRLDSLIRSGLHSITVSLDGFEEEHFHIRQNKESFARAVEAVKMISADAELASDVVTCVTPALMPKLAEFKEFLYSLGVRRWRLFTIFPVGRAATDSSLQLNDEEFTYLMQFIEATRKEGRIKASYGCEGFLGGYEMRVRTNPFECYAGVGIASIRVNGDISGCTSVRANFTQGNIYHDNFWDVWQNRFEKFRNRAWAKKGKCADCKMWQYCEGNGMHLYDNDENLLVCHYHRLCR
ncbi:MAG: TIGR04133 family radical SAM/SPASM protein [Alistipes sp.]|nr:TIGR04133 family radical SAM/SPASM protein [Alistipes sp.]